ncbi:hypothetical protein JCM13369A_29230 [Mediterraneibacter glycyrrhizinilyticus JCM 13369]
MEKGVGEVSFFLERVCFWKTFAGNKKFLKIASVYKEEPFFHLYTGAAFVYKMCLEK